MVLLESPRTLITIITVSVHNQRKIIRKIIKLSKFQTSVFVWETDFTEMTLLAGDEWSHLKNVVMFQCYTDSQNLQSHQSNSYYSKNFTVAGGVFTHSFNCDFMLQWQLLVERRLRILHCISWTDVLRTQCSDALS